MQSLNTTPRVATRVLYARELHGHWGLAFANYQDIFYEDTKKHTFKTS
jgi:hypothetical protein